MSRKRPAPPAPPPPPAAGPQQADAPDDAKARQAIERDLDVSMLVEAGAGSGKTTCVAKRMVAVIREGRHEIDHLAAITFTDRKSVV